MPLPAALLSRLAKRGILSAAKGKNKDLLGYYQFFQSFSILKFDLINS